jgi:hypothetical protein
LRAYYLLFALCAHFGVTLPSASPILLANGTQSPLLSHPFKPPSQTHPLFTLSSIAAGNQNKRSRLSDQDLTMPPPAPIPHTSPCVFAEPAHTASNKRERNATVIMLSDVYNGTAGEN